tara:strand:+ start:1583 stop:2125 length:543 start_codon:yes stop_codon:yes gene_type:complete
MKKIDFKDFMAVDYAPGEDGQIKRNAKERKEAKVSKVCKDCGDTFDKPTTDCKHDSHDPKGSHWVEATVEANEDVDEALNMQQRRQRSRSMKKFQARLKMGRKKAKMKVANPAVLKRRANKAARNAMAKKMMKGQSRANMTPARKQEIEKRLDKMQPRIQRLSKKLLPKLRQAELGRKRT